MVGLQYRSSETMQAFTFSTREQGDRRLEEGARGEGKGAMISGQENGLIKWLGRVDKCM